MPPEGATTMLEHAQEAPSHDIPTAGILSAIRSENRAHAFRMQLLSDPKTMKSICDGFDEAKDAPPMTLAELKRAMGLD